MYSSDEPLLLTILPPVGPHSGAAILDPNQPRLLFPAAGCLLDTEGGLILYRDKLPVLTDKSELAGPGIRTGAVHHGGGVLVPETPMAVELQTVAMSFAVVKNVDSFQDFT